MVAAPQKEELAWKIFLLEVGGASSAPQGLQNVVWCSLLLLPFSSYSERRHERETSGGTTFKSRIRAGFYSSSQPMLSSSPAAQMLYSGGKRSLCYILLVQQQVLNHRCFHL